MSSDCPICLQKVRQDQCMVDCAAAHVMHYQCIKNSIKIGKKQCPLDRQNIVKCIHDGDVKLLPDPPQQEPQSLQFDIVEFEDTPCYICHCNTRDQLQFDEVVVCSGCESIFCHAQCQQRVTLRQFNFGVMWFCPVCRQQRLRNSRTRTNSTNGNQNRRTRNGIFSRGSNQNQIQFQQSMSSSNVNTRSMRRNRL